MRSRPTFGVIIPTYNRAARLERTLESVWSQKEPPAEVIVIDDCSNDDTTRMVAGLMKTHQHLHYVRHDRNMERAEARNTGMSRATTDYVTFLDSDDLMYPANILDAARFAAETGAHFFHNLYESVDEEGRHLRYWPSPSVENHLRSLATGNFLACTGVFIHRDIYSQFCFDTQPLLTGSEDYDFWLRVGAAHRLGRIPALNSAIVEHSGRSMHNQDLELATRRIHYILDKVDSDPQLTSAYGPYRSLMRASRMVFLAGIANDHRDPKAAVGFLKQALAEKLTMALSPRFIRCGQIAAANWFRSLRGTSA